MPLKRKDLDELKHLKKELAKLDKQIERLEMKDIPVVAGKVKGSSKYFPYIEVRTSVLMDEPKTADAVNKLIKIKYERYNQVDKKIIELEQFIKDIPDSLTRQIFEMYFQQGLIQREIAEKLNLERSTVSKKITEYLNFHTNHILK